MNISQPFTIIHPAMNHLTNYFTSRQTEFVANLNIQKSSGPNGLSTSFLKKIAVEIAEPLSKLYSTSLQSGLIPLAMQCHCCV